MSRTEKVVWIIFAITCIQLTFLKPYLKLLPGAKINELSTLLCCLSLGAALSFRPRSAVNFKSPAVIITLLLVALAALSAFFSLAPRPAAFRVLSLAASAAGGFWCARLVLSTPESQRRFVWLGILLFIGIIVMSLAGYLKRHNIDFYLDAGNTHPDQDMIFLLSFAPLALLKDGSRRLRMFAVALLGIGFIPLCLSERVSVMVIPLGVLVLGAMLSAVRWQHLLIILALMAVVAGSFQHKIWWKKFSPAFQSYRLENFPFSWNIARQHPWLGIGITTPREKFLKDYQVKYPFTKKDEFAKVVASIITADNTFLTFMAGLGIPFLLIYASAVLILMAKLARLAFKPPPGLVLPPVALLVPLFMALAHFQFYDGPLFIQNSWFFHLLLGLIPLQAGVLVKETALQPDGI
jgi:hypothetical protein